MSILLVLAVSAFFVLAWYLTREDDSGPKNQRSHKSQRKSERERAAESESQVDQLPKSSPKRAAPRTIPLVVYDLVTETDEACEHVVWFTRCEGDEYEVVINGVSVSKGTGPDLDVAHVRDFSSVAMMTAEKIAFPLSVRVNVFRDGQLFGQGEHVVRGPGEPLPN
jgi:hypothetical protein